MIKGPIGKTIKCYPKKTIIYSNERPYRWGIKSAPKGPNNQPDQAV